MIERPSAIEAGPSPADAILAVPLTTPFIAPEALARRSGHAELLRLGANESAFGPPPRALAAMRDEVARSAWYGDPEGVDLRAALAAKHRCDMTNICLGAGIDELLGLAVRSYCSPGDVAVGARGTYPTFVYHVVGHGARFETIDYTLEGTIDLDRLAARAHEFANTRIVYLANPDNPSGSFATRAAVEKLARSIPSRALLVLDEAYADFVPREELPGDEIDPRVLRLRTFSKAYGMAGARVAYALGSTQTIESFQKIRNHFSVNRVALAGALAALHEEGFVSDVVAEIARGRIEYEGMARAYGTAALPSRTNFVLVDLGTKARAEAMVAALLALGVFVRKPGLPPLDRYVRITVGNAGERKRLDTAFGEALRALDASESRV